MYYKVHQQYDDNSKQLRWLGCRVWPLLLVPCLYPPSIVRHEFSHLICVHWPQLKATLQISLIYLPLCLYTRYCPCSSFRQLLYLVPRLLTVSSLLSVSTLSLSFPFPFLLSLSLPFLVCSTFYFGLSLVLICFFLLLRPLHNHLYFNLCPTLNRKQTSIPSTSCAHLIAYTIPIIMPILYIYILCPAHTSTNAQFIIMPIMIWLVS